MTFSHTDYDCPRKGMVRLDRAKLRDRLGKMGEGMGRPSGPPAPGTWSKALAGECVFVSSAKKIARYLKLGLEELLLPRQRAPLAVEDALQWPQHPEWRMVEETRSGWVNASNGLQHFRCEVRHAFLGDRDKPARGAARFYDLRSVADREQNAISACLTRHPELSRELDGHDAFVRNFNVLPVARGEFWWVIDEWLPGQSLATAIANGPLAPLQLKSVLRQIARGLQVLHDRTIFLRELAPQRLWLTPEDHIRFTDMALAKLPGNARTVSADWPVDVFRAPEVSDGKVTAKADLFSWGLIALQAATGNAALHAGDVDAIESTELPADLKRLVRACLSAMPRKRPGGVAALLDVWDA